MSLKGSGRTKGFPTCHIHKAWPECGFFSVCRQRPFHIPCIDREFFQCKPLDGFLMNLENKKLLNISHIHKAIPSVSSSTPLEAGERVQVILLGSTLLIVAYSEGEIRHAY